MRLWGEGKGAEHGPTRSPLRGPQGPSAAAPPQTGQAGGACSVVKPGFTPVVLKDKAPDPYGLVPMSLVL